MKIQSTTEYSRFLSPRIQRDVDISKVQRIKANMRERGFLKSFHLIVRAEGGSFRIIHGQHRYLAAKELGIPIWYMIDNTLSDSDAVDPWSGRWILKDVVQGFSSAGNAQYAYLLRFAREHKISQTIAAVLLLGNASLGNNSEWVREFNVGNFVVKDQEYAMTVVGMAKEFAPYIKWWNEANFIRAVAALLRVPGLKFDHLKRRIGSNTSMLQKKRTMSEYIKMLEDIYNSRTKTEDLLNIFFLWEQSIRNQRAQNLSKGNSVRLDEEQKLLSQRQHGLLSRLLAA